MTDNPLACQANALHHRLLNSRLDRLEADVPSAAEFIMGTKSSIVENHK